MSQIKIKIQRHIAKAISYRFVGTLTTIIIGFIFTHDFLIASSLGFVEILVKPFIYFLHERVWYKWIKYGVVHVPDKKLKIKSISENESKILDESSLKTFSKSPTKLTEGKIKSPIKNHEGPLIETEPPPIPKPKTKKTLNYTSNR